MHHWKVSLLREGRIAREWHVRADTLTVGSHGSNLVRLPPPAGAFALRVESAPEPFEAEVDGFRLLVEDETELRRVLWRESRDRVEAQAFASEIVVPDERSSPARAAFLALAVVGIARLGGDVVVDRLPPPAVFPVVPERPDPEFRLPEAAPDSGRDLVSPVLRPVSAATPVAVETPSEGVSLRDGAPSGSGTHQGSDGKVLGFALPPLSWPPMASDWPRPVAVHRTRRALEPPRPPH